MLFLPLRVGTGEDVLTIIVVAADGSGDFRTVQHAVDHVPDNNKQRVVIQIKPGVYHEQIRVNAGKRYLTFRGDDPRRRSSLIRLSAQQAGNTRLAFSTLVNADDFRAENLTFENSFGMGSQAVALFVDADRAEFRNCRFLGWQDTLFVNGSRHSFKDCYIEGHVDFIFGSASAVFENCTIHSKGAGLCDRALPHEQRREHRLCFCALSFDGTKYRRAEFILAGRGDRMRALFFIDCWLGHTSSRKVGTTGAIRRARRLRGLLSTNRQARARIRMRVSRGPNS